jgi:L-fucose dehydrogenase
LNLQLLDKVVLVTGGAKGIGAAIAHALAQAGALPVVVDRDVEAGEKIRAALGRVSARSLFVSADLTPSKNCLRAVEQAAKALGKIDALINNAGINDRIALEQGSPEQYVGSLQQNLFHYYNMAHYALPYLKSSRGSIVNMSSKTAITGQGGTSGYASSKGVILALTREWAVELLPYGIRVNAVAPAEVMTPLYQQWLSAFPNSEEKLQTIVSKIPLEKRMTRAEEIAAMAVFLISAKAAHITGQHVFVDGGYVHLDRALT